MKSLFVVGVCVDVVLLGLTLAESLLGAGEPLLSVGVWRVIFTAATALFGAWFVAFAVASRTWSAEHEQPYRLYLFPALCSMAFVTAFAWVSPAGMDANFTVVYCVVFLPRAIAVVNLERALWRWAPVA
jgi:hypothetical protein